MGILFSYNRDFSNIKKLMSISNAKKLTNIKDLEDLDPNKIILPKVVLIVAISQDGFLASNSKDSLNWVPKQDKLWFRKKTIKIGNLIIGKKTFNILPKKALEKRRYWVFTHSVEHGHVAVLKENIFLVNMKAREFLKYLSKKNIKKVAIVGGQKIYDLFLSNKLVDVIYLSQVNVKLKQGIKFNVDVIKNNFRIKREFKFDWGVRYLYKKD